jgi:hypothetical protein
MKFLHMAQPHGFHGSMLYGLGQSFNALTCYSSLGLIQGRTPNEWTANTCQSPLGDWSQYTAQLTVDICLLTEKNDKKNEPPMYLHTKVPSKIVVIHSNTFPPAKASESFQSFPRRHTLSLCPHHLCVHKIPISKKTMSKNKKNSRA